MKANNEHGLNILNRRSFIRLMAAAGSSTLLSGASFGQNLKDDMQPAQSTAEQSKAIRAAAIQFIQTLTTTNRDRVCCPFPSGATPVAAKFTRNGGASGSNRQTPNLPSNHPPDNGPGFKPNGPGGPGGGGFAGFIGEKFGLSVWSNFPVSDVIRPGVRMGEFSLEERASVHQLLRAALSSMGYQKVLNIMAADQKLADGGLPYAAGLDAYTIALLGEPDVAKPWMLQFGGHHLGLNIIFAGDQAVCAPLHTGILPSKFTADGKTIRGLGKENDQAFDLLASLTPDQLKATLIEHEISDLLCGPGHPQANFPKQGLKGSDMTAAQRQMMFGIACEWVGVLNETHAAKRLESVRQAMNETYFAWSGSTKHDAGENGEAYFRIHGPGLLIENAPQDNQGGYKLHVHTVMRDLQGDYGKQII